MTPVFNKELEGLGRKLVWWKARLFLVFGIAAVLLAVWFLGLIDIWLRYDRPGRVVSSLLFLGALGGTLWLFIKTLRSRYTIQGVAASVEKAFPSLDNQLINYIQFSQDKEGNPFKQAYLKHVSPAWDQVNPGEMQNRKLHRQSFAAVGLAALLLLLPGLFLGAAWPRALARVVNPFSNLPPISLTHILEVQPGVATVMQGEPLVLSCTVQGMEGHSVMVEVDPDDAKTTRTDLGRITSGQEENFARRIPRVTTGFRYRFKAGDATPSDWNRIDIRPPSAFTDIQLKISPPDYMGLSPQSVDGRDPRLRIAQGSVVEVQATCNMPLTKGTAAVAGGRDVALAMARDASNWSGHLTIAEGQELVIKGVDEHGGEVEEKLTYTLASDLAPTVEVTEPRGRTVLPPGATPRISFKVKDDFGLATVALEKQVIARDGSRTWEAVETWDAGSQKGYEQAWSGILKDRKPGALTYRVIARDTCAASPNTGASASIVFDAQSMGEALKERNKLEAKATASLNQVVEWQRQNIKGTHEIIQVSEQAAKEQWAELTARQENIRKVSRELLENPLKPLGKMSGTVKKLYLNEMSQAVSLLSGIPNAAPADRGTKAKEAEGLQGRILRQLTAAEVAMSRSKVDRRVTGITAMLTKMVKAQAKTLDETKAVDQGGKEVRPALVDTQDMLAADLTEFAQTCSDEAAAVRANDTALADVMEELSRRCESDKIRNDMMLAAEKLDQNQAKAAIPHEEKSLAKLKSLETLLNGVKLKQEVAEQAEMHEDIGQAKEKLARIKDLHKKVLGFMEQVGEQKDVSDEQVEMMQESYEELIKNTKEALLEVPTDLHIFTDLNVANDMVEDVFAVYQELEQTAGSEKWTEEKVFEEAYFKEEWMLAQMEEAEDRIEDVEMWLVEDPDMKKITAEAFDKEEMPDQIALGALPSELQDLITDLKEQDEGADEAADDSATNHAMPDLEVGGPVLEGDISSFAAKGVSGGDRPDHKEQDGRSGVGRQGMSNGETAAASGTINEGDNDIEARRTKDPTQGGQVDLDGEADTVATGGGKLATGKADDMGMAGGVKRMDSNEQGSWEGMAALLAKRTDSLYAKASMKNIRVDSLKEAAHHIRQSQDAIARGNITQVRELRKLAVGALMKAQTDLQAGPTTAYESGKGSSFLGDVVESSPDTAPPQYRDQVAEYYKVLNEAL